MINLIHFCILTVCCHQTIWVVKYSSIHSFISGLCMCNITYIRAIWQEEIIKAERNTIHIFTHSTLICLLPNNTHPSITIYTMLTTYNHDNHQNHTIIVFRHLCEANNYAKYWTCIRVVPRIGFSFPMSLIQHIHATVFLVNHLVMQLQTL